ncbi:LamG-like jellyroll fold domain-containing protein [Streptomyces sp. NPDC020996]|uniref:LamG-like jellyroll fold domain-containing protein n=1 Tax=Streptomyces sp. NPDC020996 TaxID=3154791 RepID=UPI0033E014DD
MAGRTPLPRADHLALALTPPTGPPRPPRGPRGAGSPRAPARTALNAVGADIPDDDPAGSGSAAAETGTAARAGTGVTESDGPPLRLGTGASIYRVSDGSCSPDLDPDCPYVPPALVGDGHLTLDGETGYAAADGPVVDTADSFTLGVVVRLADAEPAHPMTALSQAGEHTDAFRVRYEPSTHAWQLVMPEKDEAGAPERVVSQIEAADGGEGQGHRLAVVYDDATDTIKLYLDGVTNAQATATLPDGWHSAGALQVGRAKAGDGWGEYLHGDVDEVQAYSGAFRDQDIPFLGLGTDYCPC